MLCSTMLSHLCVCADWSLRRERRGGHHWLPLWSLRLLNWSPCPLASNRHSRKAPLMSGGSMMMEVHVHSSYTHRLEPL